MKNLKLKSKIKNESYELYVKLPETYSKSTNSYPVVFVLDGAWDFNLVSSISGNLRSDLYIPESIVIGITYSGENRDINKLRAIDFSLEDDGDGSLFFEVIKEDIIPYFL